MGCNVFVYFVFPVDVAVFIVFNNKSSDLISEYILLSTNHYVYHYCLIRDKHDKDKIDNNSFVSNLFKRYRFT